MLASLLLCLLVAGPRNGDGQLHVWFLDVGHGDATLLSSPAGRTVLIDSGPATAGGKLRQRLPQLLKHELDLLVLTSPADEHLGAMGAAIDTVGARRLLDSGQRGDTGLAHAQLLALAQQRAVTVLLPAPDPAARGELVSIDLGGGAWLEVLWPRTPVEPWLSSPNKAAANGVVLRASFGTTSVLLMADAQPETEDYLVRSLLIEPTTLLKVSEHGAEKGSSPAFLAAARPLASIISVGAGNPLGAPARAALQRLAEAGARVFRTDLDGDVHAVSDGHRFTVTTERLAPGEPPGARWLFPPAPVVATGPPPPPPPPRVRQSRPLLALDDAPPRPLPVSAPASAPAARAKGPPKPSRSEEPGPKVAAPEPGAAEYRKSAVDDGLIMVLVAKKGERVFHYPECPAAREIPREQMVVFTSRAEASKRLKPASDCRP